MKPAPPLWGRPAKFLEHSLRPGRRIGWFVLFAALFAAQVVPRIFQDSAYLDEAWETTSGYYYWLRGDAAPPYNHPPLANALQALPLVFLHLKVDPNVWQEGENRAYSLYYVSNPGRLGTILEAPRFLMLGFALAFGFLLYRVVLREKGAVFLAALFLWAFDPTLLSFSIVSKADMPFSFFCFAGLLLFRRGQVERSWKWDALAGALAGAAVTSKMTALCLPVLYGGWDLWEAWKRPAFRGALVRRWAVGSAACAGVVFLVYFPGTLRLADHRWPFAYFLSRVREALGTGGELGTVCGFLGGFYPRAEWWQVPVMFVLKSPLPFLALLALGGTLWARGKVRLPDWAWIFPIGWTALLCVSPLVYMRYLMPAYPALLWIAAQGAGWLWEKAAGRGKALVLALGFWQAASLALNFPEHAAYFNDLVPPGARYGLLDRRDYDLDQDMKRLVQRSRARGWKHIQLAYDAQSDPYYYGLPLWEPWSLADLRAPRPGTVYLVQESFLHREPAWLDAHFPIERSWVARTPPTGRVGACWRYYEVPGQWTPDRSPSLDSTPALVYQNAPYRKGMAGPRLPGRRP